MMYFGDVILMMQLTMTLLIIVMILGENNLGKSWHLGKPWGRINTLYSDI